MGTSGNSIHERDLMVALMERSGVHIFPSNRNELLQNLEVSTSVF
jgi:hypothetical protein